MLKSAYNTEEGSIAVCYPSTGHKSLPYLKPYGGTSIDQVYSGSQNIAIIGIGHMVEIAYEAAVSLHANAYILRQVAPLQLAPIKDIISSYSTVIILEDGIKIGSVGEQISASFRNTECKLIHMCHKDGIIPHATIKEQLALSHLTVQDVINEVEKADC